MPKPRRNQGWVESITRSFLVRLGVLDSTGTYTPPSGGGSAPEGYSVVKASGGDYTSVKAAIDDGAFLIYVEEGTTEPSGASTLTGDTKILGGSQDTMISFQSNNGTILMDNDYDLTFENVGIQFDLALIESTTNSSDKSTVYLRNCHIDDNSTANVQYLVDGCQVQVRDCVFDLTNNSSKNDCLFELHDGADGDYYSIIQNCQFNAIGNTTGSGLGGIINKNGPDDGVIVVRDCVFKGDWGSRSICTLFGRRDVVDNCYIMTNDNNTAAGDFGPAGIKTRLNILNNFGSSDMDFGGLGDDELVALINRQEGAGSETSMSFSDDGVYGLLRFNNFSGTNDSRPIIVGAYVQSSDSMEETDGKIVAVNFQGNVTIKNPKSTFIGCHFQGSVTLNASADGTKFIGCKFDDASTGVDINASCDYVWFIGCEIDQQVLTDSSGTAYFVGTGTYAGYFDYFNRNVNQTSNVTVSNQEADNRVFTNRGASGTVTLTAPTVFAGYQITLKRVATHAFRFDPGTAAILSAAGLQTADKYLELGSDGAFVKLVFDGTTWNTVAEGGTITYEP